MAKGGFREALLGLFAFCVFAGESPVVKGCLGFSLGFLLPYRSDLFVPFMADATSR